MNTKTCILIPSAAIEFETGLKPCIESLRLHTDFRTDDNKILIVANGMENREALDLLGTEYIWFDKPLGYVGAINAGLKHILAQPDRPDFVLFLNDDTAMRSRQWLELLQYPFETDPLMGLVGAKSLPCPITGVDFPLGFCVLIKTELFDKIGMLDECWGLGYGDDTDFYIRAIQAGYHSFSYVNGFDRKTHKSEGAFPVYHAAEKSMHSGKFFSIDEWDAHTANNRNKLAEKYWETVHIVVPTYKRYIKLRKTLDSIKNQNYWKIIVHVVADGDDSEVKEIVQEYTNQCIVSNNFAHRQMKWEYSFITHVGDFGGAPRIAVLETLPDIKNEWVCFVDDDNLIVQNYVFYLWQATFLKNIGGAWCKIFHVEEGRNIPEGDFQKAPTWTHIDALNYLVRVDLAKKHRQKWAWNGKEQMAVDFSFFKACFDEEKFEFIDEVLGSHGQETSILVLTVCRDEEKMIPFFLRHYERFADKILVFDGGSTDKSLELLKASTKVEIISVPAEKMDETQLIHFRNEGWKPHRYDFDWVIVVDVDEFIWHPDIKKKLEEFRRARITVPSIIGYQMVSNTFPDNQLMQLYDAIRTGYPDPEHLNKLSVFNPKFVDINYEYGCHKAHPSGSINMSSESLKLLHYKYAGYAEFIERNKRMAARISEENKKKNLAFHYARDAEMPIGDFRALQLKAKIVVDPQDAGNPLSGRRDLKNQNHHIFHEIIELNQYRVDKQDFQGKNIIDVGANIGIFSLLANEYGAVKIVAVEPHADTLKILRSNVAGRGILVVDKAVGLKEGSHVQMIVRPEFANIDGRIYSQKADIGVETITLDHLVTLIDDGKPILLKVDCEGAEYDLFYGASLSALGKIQTICIEMHENIYKTEGQIGIVDKLRKFLVSIGFIEKFVEDNTDYRVRLLRYDRVTCIDDDVTVVVSIFNRPELLAEQIKAIKNQTLKPKEIIVWQTKSKHWEKEVWDVDNREVSPAGWVETHFDIPEGVKLVVAEDDFKLPARFAATLFANTNYVCLLDDDVFPAEGWLEEALKVSKQNNSVVSAYGMVYDSRIMNDGMSTRYGDQGKHIEDPAEVDVGGHSWFGRKEWFSVFFKESVVSETEGDDLHFACMLQKYTNVKIFVSSYPEGNHGIWANTQPDLGMGLRALHARRWADEKIWTDPNKISWGMEEKEYLKKNLEDFNVRRANALSRYADRGWSPIYMGAKQQKSQQEYETQFIPIQKNLEVVVDISTKNRYHSTLPLTLLSVISQTYPVKKIIIVDDSDPAPDGKMLDLREDTLYQYIFSMIMKKGIQWEVVFGARKGQHHNHQIILDRVTNEFIWRLDDDEYAEPDVLEKLVKRMDPGVGAVAGLVLDPKLFQDAPANYLNTNRLADINTKENTQWFRQPKGRVFEVEHLYSSFLFRKVEDIKYCLELSPAAHREETLFSYEYVRKGYKVLVTTDAITWHLRNPEGGIRAHHQTPEFWANDDRVFQRKLESWKINTKGKKLVIIDLGIGDTICFLEIMPELLKKYPDLVIGTYYSQIFKNYPVQLLHTFQAKDILGEKLAELQNPYRYLWAQKDKGRKIHLIEALREMFLEGKE